MIPFNDLPLYDLPATTPLKVIGESQRSFWIMLSKSEETNPSLQDFLSKILKALGLDMNLHTYRIVSDNSHSLDLSKQLSNLAEPKTIISFGFKPEEIGFSIAHRPYQLLKIRNHQFLFCDFLDSIQNDPTKKRALWETLQLLR